MDKLWAPWRIEYIKSPKPEGCFFCQYIQEKDDRKRLILHRGKNAFVIMNYYPYNNGHIMVVPYQHTSELSDLDSETKAEILDLIDIGMKALRETLTAEGFNVGLNSGQIAGAGVDDHLHFHIVPRWSGDTNFMPVLGHTKVVSQGLQETWELLKKVFDRHS